MYACMNEWPRHRGSSLIWTRFGCVYFFGCGSGRLRCLESDVHSLIPLCQWGCAWARNRRTSEQWYLQLPLALGCLEPSCRHATTRLTWWYWGARLRVASRSSEDRESRFCVWRRSWSWERALSQSTHRSSAKFVSRESRLPGSRLLGSRRWVAKSQIGRPSLLTPKV